MHGQPMDVVQDPATKRWKPKQVINNGWNQALWGELFDAFLNVPDCNSLPLLSQYRHKLEQYIMSDRERVKAVKLGICKQNSLLFDQ